MLSDFITYLENNEIKGDNIREFQSYISKYLIDFCEIVWQHKMINNKKGFYVNVKYLNECPKAFRSTPEIFVKNSRKAHYGIKEITLVIYADNKDKVEKYIHSHLDNPQIEYLF